MSRPFAWSSFFALITGGMKAPSDGALKITTDSFSSVCACAPAHQGAVPIMMASASTNGTRSNRFVIIRPLPRNRGDCSSISPDTEQFLGQPTRDRGSLVGLEPGRGDDLGGLLVSDRERH